MTATIRVGPAGWSYPDWEGRVYPSGKGRGFDRLAFLAGYFDLIEINATFYRPASPAVAAGWARRVAENPVFRFTAKLHRNFTHEETPVSTGELRIWNAGLEPLRAAGLLGAVLAQFPYSFHCTEENRSKLSRIRELFPGDPLVLEARHRSWGAPEVAPFLKEQGIGFCNIDQPPVSYSLPPSAIATSPVGYVRLHGRNAADWFREDAGRDDRYNYLYSAAELTEWTERMRTVGKKVPAVYVVANNHFRGQAACNALEIRSRLEGRKVRVPPPLLAAYPRLREIASPEETGLPL
jgi:uncharacterized protein YecE (DUF72 family)